MFKKITMICRHPLKFVKILWQDFLAHRRGQVRLVPRIGLNGSLDTRGRIYGTPTKEFISKSKKSVRLEMRVQRADGSVEIYVSDDKGFRRKK